MIEKMPNKDEIVDTIEDKIDEIEDKYIDPLKDKMKPAADEMKSFMSKWGMKLVFGVIAVVVVGSILVAVL